MKKMKIRQLQLLPYDILYSHGYRRLGALIQLESENGDVGVGDLAPLKERSRESLLQTIAQFKEYESVLTSVKWDKDDFIEQLTAFPLFPSLSFALESALFSILTPRFSCSLDVAALLMGNSVKEIMTIAEMRKKEGFQTVKLKIGNLSPDVAFTVINELKGTFKLRIDANSRWSLSDSMRFFSQFPVDLFDYVEDPVESIAELQDFPFPIAVEELISRGISLTVIEKIPTLKAVTYKPTVQGGYLIGQQLKKWADERGISLVLSSSLESDVGHFHIAAMAARLGLTAPIGIGTYHYLNQHLSKYKLNINKGKLNLDNELFLAHLEFLSFG
jgi:o-succinylbenzoate synthase